MPQRRSPHRDGPRVASRPLAISRCLVYFDGNIATRRPGSAGCWRGGAICSTPSSSGRSFQEARIPQVASGRIRGDQDLRLLQRAVDLVSGLTGLWFSRPGSKQLGEQIEGLELGQPAAPSIAPWAIQDELLVGIVAGEQSGGPGTAISLAQLEDSLHPAARPQLGQRHVGYLAPPAACQGQNEARRWADASGQSVSTAKEPAPPLGLSTPGSRGAERANPRCQDVFRRTYIRASATGTVQSVGRGIPRVRWCFAPWRRSLSPKSSRRMNGLNGSTARIPPQYIDSMYGRPVLPRRSGSQRSRSRTPEVVVSREGPDDFTRCHLRPQEESEPPYYFSTGFRSTEDTASRSYRPPGSPQACLVERDYIFKHR